ncbi:probable receptor-like protein kinase [Tanacetum coccineum]
MVFILKACFTISSDDHSSKVADCGTTTITCNSSSKAFSWDEITKASKNFSKVIGSGGFSTVYLARLSGVLTAVKIQSSCTDRLARIHDQELHWRVARRLPMLLYLFVTCPSGSCWDMSIS